MLALIIHQQPTAHIACIHVAPYSSLVSKPCVLHQVQSAVNRATSQLRILAGAAQPPTWPGPVSYIGGFSGFTTGMSMWPNPSNRQGSDVAAVYLNSVADLPSNVSRVAERCQAHIDGEAVNVSMIICKIADSTGGTGFLNVFQYVHEWLISTWDLGTWK